MKNKYLELFLTFLKIGAFTFGGGYAMVSLIEREIAERKQWITKEDVLDMVAIAESTPGPIAINSATFVGYRREGVPGALCATFGLVLPSFIIISLVSVILKQFMDFKAVQYAFEGIRVGIVVMIIGALVSMAKSCKRDWFFYIEAILAFVLVAFFGVSSILVLLCGGVLGAVLTFAGVLKIKE